MSGTITVPAYYQPITPEKVAALMQFRQLEPRYTRIDTHQWRYTVLGSAADTLLLLPGGGGTSETVFRYALKFADSFRVILPDLPTTLQNTEDALQGLRGLLAQESANRVHVVGIAWGGGLAQLFVRRFPHVVDDLVLTQTALPDELLAARARMQAAWIRLYPPALLRALSRRAMLRALHTTPMNIPNDERNFWLAYFTEYYARFFRKVDLASRVRLSAQYFANPPFQSTDLQHWKGRVLIIESEFDEVIGEGERGALKAMYPGAYVQMLEGAAHLASVLMSETLAASIHKFLVAEA
jgi:pimeloyl-ACP methyl ester carboxylesterase